MRSDTGVQLNREWSKARIEGLAADSSVGRLGAMLITIGPGGMCGKEPYQPPREEFAMVLDDKILLTLGSRSLPHPKPIPALRRIARPA